MRVFLGPWIMSSFSSFLSFFLLQYITKLRDDDDDDDDENNERTAERKKKL